MDFSDDHHPYIYRETGTAKYDVVTIINLATMIMMVMMMMTIGKDLLLLLLLLNDDCLQLLAWHFAGASKSDDYTIMVMRMIVSS